MPALEKQKQGDHKFKATHHLHREFQVSHGYTGETLSQQTKQKLNIKFMLFRCRFRNSSPIL